VAEGPGEFSIVESVEALKALAHPDRLSILRELRGSPKSAAEVARAIELTPQKVGYHIRKMEAAGLVHFVRAGRKRWKEERLFEAVARQFLVDPAFACDDAETRAGVAAELEVRLRESRREATLEGGLDRLARRVVEGTLGLQPGQRLLILSGPFTLDLVDALFVATEALGADAVQHPWGRGYIFGRLDVQSGEQLAATGLFPASLTESVDAVVRISCSIPQGAPPSPAQREKLPSLLGSIPVWEARLRERSVPILEISVPTSRDFALLSSPELGMDTFWRAFDQDLDVVETRARGIAKRLESARRLTLADGQGGELVFQPLRVAAPERQPVLSVPSGAHLIRIAPDSGSGQLVADYTAAGGRHFQGPGLQLEAGRLVGLEGADELALLEQRIASEGEAVRAFAFLTIGVSRVGRELTGKTSLDSILEGVITLGFGSDGFLGGTRVASLDLRFPLRNGTLLADGEVVVEAGRLVLGD
jgi:DNA-binding transcriptional ArsR family regulator